MCVCVCVYFCMCVCMCVFGLSEGKFPAPGSSSCPQEFPEWADGASWINVVVVVVCACVCVCVLTGSLFSSERETVLTCQRVSWAQPLSLPVHDTLHMAFLTELYSKCQNERALTDWWQLSSGFNRKSCKSTNTLSPDKYPVNEIFFVSSSSKHLVWCFISLVCLEQEKNKYFAVFWPTGRQETTGAPWWFSIALS